MSSIDKLFAKTLSGLLRVHRPVPAWVSGGRAEIRKRGFLAEGRRLYNRGADCVRSSGWGMGCSQWARKSTGCMGPIGLMDTWKDRPIPMEIGSTVNRDS